MDSIVYHQNQSSINSYPSHLKAGTINQLDRKSYKQLININSRFRNNYTITPASDFGFNLPTPIKKVVSMKVISVNLPKVIYTVSSVTGSNAFLIGNGSAVPDYPIDISNGSYSGQDMATHITTSLLQTTDFSDVILNYSKISGKMRFSRPSGANFTLNFDYISPSDCPNTFSQTGSNIFRDQLTLGWTLGFRQNYQYRTPLNATRQPAAFQTNKQLRAQSIIHSRRPVITPEKNNGFQYLEPYNNCCTHSTYETPTDISFTYTGSTVYHSEGIYDPVSNAYFLLGIDDFQNNHSNSVVSPLQQETFGSADILAVISSSCCDKCCSEPIPRIYFGPTDIAKLHIKLYDEFGRIVDMNNGDYSFKLEVEILYDL
jgi:hypothetical protein